MTVEDRYRTLGGGAALGAALAAVAVGLAVVVVDLLWLPWPALLLFVVMVAAVAAMAVRLIRTRLPTVRPGPEKDPVDDAWAHLDTVPLDMDRVNMRRQRG